MVVLGVYYVFNVYLLWFYYVLLLPNVNYAILPNVNSYYVILRLNAQCELLLCYIISELSLLPK